jgi:hypothetical protein
MKSQFGFKASQVSRLKLNGNLLDATHIIELVSIWAKANEGTFSTVQSLLSSDFVHKVDPSEV